MTTVERWSLLTAVKLLLLAVVVVGGASALVRDARPAHAMHTRIFVSYSSTCLTDNTVLIAFVGGPPQDVYLCAKDIDNNPWGAAAFNLELKYTSWLVGVNAVDIGPANYSGPWLTSTGRSSLACLAPTIDPSLEDGQGHVTGGCWTIGTDPPYGPMSNGVLAKITLQPGIVKAITNFDFRGTVGQPNTATNLVSAYFEAGGTYGAVLIPTNVLLVPVYVNPCADYVPAPNGDNFVSVIDILNLAQKFGRTPNSPPPPTWNPDWDMDGNNQVTVFDVLYAAKQFGRTCPS